MVQYYNIEEDRAERLGVVTVAGQLGKQVEKMNEKSFQEIGEILQGLGVTGIVDDILEELESHYPQLEESGFNGEFDKVAVLLSRIGDGDYDYDNMTWTPGNSNVYSFDAEVFDIVHMYTHFLRGVSAISQGELEFTDIQEDWSAVDWEEDTGVCKVEFIWNGRHYELDVAAQGDWFNNEFADALNQLIMTQGSDKRLFFTGDGYQACIVFYCDEAWAKNFVKVTGHQLYNTL